MLFWNANVIFIWCTNVKEGVMHSAISFKNLFESTDHTRSVGHWSNVETNNTKTTLSHSTRICNSNYDVWSTTRNPQCETGTRGTLQRAIVMTRPLLKYTIQTENGDQRVHAWPLHWNHYQGEGGCTKGWRQHVPDAFVALKTYVEANHCV